MLWARRAADQGDFIGEAIVGSLHDRGQGVPRNLQAAIFWLSRSAAQGFEEAGQRLLTLAADGVPEAVAAVRRLRLTR
jgi:TPR repeat protein